MFALSNLVKNNITSKAPLKTLSSAGITAIDISCYF